MAVVALLISACPGERAIRGGSGRDALVRYDDLVTEGRAFGDAGPRGQRICADQTRFARPLASGETLGFEVELGREPVLVLSVCPEESGGGALEVVAAGERGAPVAALVQLGRSPAWTREEVDLSSLAGRSVTIELTAATPRGRKLYLQDAYVRHVSPTPAPWPEPEPDAELDVLSKAPASAATFRGNGRPQILLISVDTLRHDKVDLLDAGETSRTPHLARFASDAEVFTIHRPGASWTKPSHATLLTGYPGSVHRADGNAAVPAALPRLPARLGGAGLATAGLVFDCVWLNPKFGFDVGFDRYRSVPWDTGQMTRSVVNWVRAHHEEPFFFFFHTYGPHSDFHRLPYESEDTYPAAVAEQFGLDDYGCREGECASALLERLGKGQIEPLPGEGEILEHLYQRGVSDVDRELGQLFRDLRELGLYDDLLIVLTSDHGELFLEHDATLHGIYWEPVLRVPLIVKWPRSEGRAGRVTEIPTSAIDVAPTILAAAGLEKGDLPGAELGRPRPDRPIFVGHPDWWVVYEGGYKAVVPDRGRRMLFDVTKDPGETWNRRFEDRDTFAKLEGRLRAFREWSETTRERLLPENGDTEQALTGEERERLRALGYLQ